MRDEMRECECGEQHPWGIINYSKDNVPLYGARPLETCAVFKPKKPEQMLLPTISNAQELWAQTGDLNAQATLATRIAVHNLRSLAKNKKGYARIAAQWPEFIGFVMSQITDLRGTLVRDESKFAHLVAHTDEIVETMRGVSQLSERLNTLSSRVGEILERLDFMDERHDAECSAEAEALVHFGLLPLADDEAVGRLTEPSPLLWRKPFDVPDLEARIFTDDDRDEDDEEDDAASRQ